MDPIILFSQVLSMAGISAAHALALASLVVPIAAVLAAFLPVPPPESPWAPLRALLDKLAFNVGHAANAAPQAPSSAEPAASRPPGLLPCLLLLALPLAGCTTAQQQLALAIAPAATGCALSAGMAVEAHVASGESDGAKAASSAVAVVTDPACLAVLHQLGTAAATKAPGG